MNKEHDRIAMLSRILAQDEVFDRTDHVMANRFVLAIIKLSNQHKILCETLCNKGSSQALNAAINDKENEIKNLIRTMVPNKLGLEINQDPRGYTIKLILPSGRSNNLGGEAWGV